MGAQPERAGTWQHLLVDRPEFEPKPLGLRSTLLGLVWGPPPTFADATGVHVGGRRPIVVRWEDVVDIVERRQRRGAERVPVLLVRDGGAVALRALAWSVSRPSTGPTPLDTLLGHWVGLATRPDGTVRVRAEPEARRRRRRYRAERAAALLALCGTLLTLVRWGARTTADDLRRSDAPLRSFAIDSIGGTIAERTSVHDPDGPARAARARDACADVGVDGLEVTIEDRGGTAAAMVTVIGTGPDGTARCTIEAYWVAWCSSRAGGRCASRGGTWLRSPAAYWQPEELSAY